MIAAIVAALLVLTLASAADAECAWVVWQMAQIQDPSRPELATRVYGAMGANGTEEGCREMSKKMNAMPDQAKSVVMYYCLPDTVDPRGVKGGGR